MNKRHRSYLLLWCLAFAVLMVSVMRWSYPGRYISNLAEKRIAGSEIMVSEASADNYSDSDIKKVIVQKDGVEASYPRLLTGGNPDSLERWNQIIKEDFDKMLQIYSFQPFPGPTPPSTDVVPMILKITYEVKENTADLLSLLYQADYNSSYSAHPSNLVYTTNIDRTQNRRLRLGDTVVLSEEFVKNFHSWELVADPEEQPEVREAIKDYINHISEEELLAGFQSADQIGSGNPWGIYSYRTKDRLGISIEVPHYAGDHAEFEQSLSVLENQGLLQRK